MRAAGAGPVELVLPAGGRVGRDAGAAPAAGRAIHPDTVLRRAADDGLAAEPGACRQPEAGAALAPAARGRGDLPEASDEHPSARPPDLPVPAAWRPDHPCRPGVEHRHYLHPPGARLDLSGRDPGLVQPLRPGLGGLEYTRQRLLRSRPRQRLRRAAVAVSQVRGGVPEELPHRPRGDRRPGRILPLLQRGASAPGSGLSHAGGGLPCRPGSQSAGSTGFDRDPPTTRGRSSLPVLTYFQPIPVLTTGSTSTRRCEPCPDRNWLE